MVDQDTLQTFQNVLSLLRKREPSLLQWVNRALFRFKTGRYKEASRLLEGVGILLEEENPLVTLTLRMLREKLDRLE